MNTLTTLFGGLAGVLVLYALGGRIRRLPPLLRAALAGGVPLLVYFVYSIGRWSGLDVAAMHLSVFMVAALMLFALSQFRRDLHWAPKLLTGFFIGLVFLNASLLYIATQGLPEPISSWWLKSDGGKVYSGFSGVVPHGENAAKGVSSALSEAHQQSVLGWKVEITGLDAAGLTRLVRVRVSDRTGLPVERADARINLLRPGTTEASHSVELQRVDAGVYGGVLELPAPGRWLAELRLVRNGELTFRSVQEIAQP